MYSAVHSTAGAWQALAVTMDCFKLLAADAAKSAQLGRQGDFLSDTIYQNYLPKFWSLNFNVLVSTAHRSNKGVVGYDIDNKLGEEKLR